MGSLSGRKLNCDIVIKAAPANPVGLTLEMTRIEVRSSPVYLCINQSQGIGCPSWKSTHLGKATSFGWRQFPESNAAMSLSSSLSRSWGEVAKSWERTWSALGGPPLCWLQYTFYILIHFLDARTFLSPGNSCSRILVGFVSWDNLQK